MKSKSGNGRGHFFINSDSGLVSVNQKGLKFNTANFYKIVIIVSDSNSNTNYIDLLVDINDINEPPFFGEILGFSISENPTAYSMIGIINAEDEDRVERHTFNVQSINDEIDSNLWVLDLNNINSTKSNAGSAKLFVTEFGENNMNYEAIINSYNVSILVTDKDGLSASCVVSVTVDDVNEPPAPNSTHTFWTRENAAVGTYIGYPISTGDPDYSDAHDYIITAWSTTGESHKNTDSSWTSPFMIHQATGQMFLEDISVLPTSGTDKIFMFEITVKDMNGLFETCTVTITVVNVNDAPEIEDQTFQVHENSQMETVVAIISATDGNSGDVLKYEFMQAFPFSGMRTFNLDETTGKITVADLAANNVTIDHEILTTYSFLVSVDDQHLTYPMYDSALITINVTDINETPAIDGEQTFTIDENADDDSVVADEIDIFDEDELETFTWSFVSAPTDLPFKIDSSTGEILTVTSTQFGSFKIPFDIPMEDETDNDRSGKGFILGKWNRNKELSGNGFSNNYMNYKWSEDKATTSGRTSVMSRSMEVEVLQGFKSWNWFGGKISVEEGQMYTVSLFLKFVDSVPDCTNDNFGLKKHSPIVVNRDFMSDIVADQWKYVEWTFTAEQTTNDEVVIFIMDSCPGGSVARVADMNFYNVQTSRAFTPLNYEVTRTYSVNVKAIDSGGLESVETITINVNDINEPPTLEPGKFFVMENAPIGTYIGSVLATDPDGSNIITYEMSVNGPNDDFAVDISSGVITVASQTIDFEMFPNTYIEITAFDSGTPQLHDIRSYEVVVMNENDLNIKSISLSSDLPTSIGSDDVRLLTEGNEHVYFHGDNIGRVYTNDNFVATYGVTGVEYIAKNCSIIIPYSLARCVSAPGCGSNHIWKFAVQPSSGVELQEKQQACAGADTGCIFNMYAPYVNKYYVLTDWLVASQPWGGVNKVNGKCTIDNAINKHVFNTADLDDIPALQDGRKWEQFVGSKQKTVQYGDYQAEDWGSACRSKMAIGDLDCHYIKNGYEKGSLEKIYTYVTTHLCSDREQEVEFGLGADDAFELWISGISVIKRSTCQSVHKDNFIFSHKLKLGHNTILLKVLDYHGENGFLLSLRKKLPWSSRHF